MDDAGARPGLSTDAVDAGSTESDPSAGDDVPRSRRGSKLPRKRLSQILAAIAQDDRRSDITIDDLMHLIEGRARAALIFLFAFPNVFPAPPGLSAVLGLPLLYLTGQMMLGRIPWLPRLIGQQGVSMPAFRAMVQRALPFLTRVERLLRPRLGWVVGPTAEHVLGAFALVLAVVVTLPIPLANMLPSFAICLIALGVLERDGLWTIFGVLAGIASLLLSGAVAYAMVKTAIMLIVQAFA